MLRANVEYKAKLRVAEAHFLNTKGRLVFTAWRIGTKLEKAMALWIGNTLRSEWGPFDISSGFRQ